MTDDRSPAQPGPHPASLPPGHGPRRHRGLPRRLRHAAAPAARHRRPGATASAAASARASAAASAARRPPATERRPPLRELDRLHRHRRRRDVPDHQEVRGGVRHHGRPTPRTSTTTRRSSPATCRRRSTRACPPSWDLVVVTDWMVARLARLGWLETIDTSLTPNFVANLAENYKARSFDPDTNLAAPVAVRHDRARVRQGQRPATSTRSRCCSAISTRVS